MRATEATIGIAREFRFVTSSLEQVHNKHPTDETAPYTQQQLERFGSLDSSYDGGNHT
jgi:hypothetical protein